MDPTTASYYRAILFSDSQDSRPLPQTLMTLHSFAFKRCQAMGIGSIIPKQTALAVAMLWMTSTVDGKRFAKESAGLGELFEEEEPPTPDWSSVKPDTPVTVNSEGTTINGMFQKRRGGWLDVIVAGETKQFRSPQVQLAKV